MATAKVPNALVFQKLWFLPDQMYHDVPTSGPPTTRCSPSAS
jgi:hypothetical protein